MLTYGEKKSICSAYIINLGLYEFVAALTDTKPRKIAIENVLKGTEDGFGAISGLAKERYLKWIWGNKDIISVHSMLVSMHYTLSSGDGVLLFSVSTIYS